MTALIAAAFFMENLDGTVIATALPQMARSFHIAAVNLNIGMTAYLLTLAVFIPISGWVADRFGARTVFASALAAFTVASVLCGLCRTLTEFTTMRVLQGMGGAMMVPVGRLIVLRTTPKDKLTQTIAYLTWPGLSALVLGPAVGGFITTYASWRWIFFLNLPLGLLACELTLWWVENIRSDERPAFDWLSFALAGFASTGV
ncbi:MAG TPA: MFS transporter, partial [Acidisarcina sp.]